MKNQEQISTLILAGGKLTSNKITFSHKTLDKLYGLDCEYDKQDQPCKFKHHGDSILQDMLKIVADQIRNDSFFYDIATDQFVFPKKNSVLQTVAVMLRQKMTDCNYQKRK